MYKKCIILSINFYIPKTWPKNIPDHAKSPVFRIACGNSVKSAWLNVSFITSHPPAELMDVIEAAIPPIVKIYLIRELLKVNQLQITIIWSTSVYTTAVRPPATVYKPVNNKIGGNECQKLIPSTTSQRIAPENKLALIFVRTLPNKDIIANIILHWVLNRSSKYSGIVDTLFCMKTGPNTKPNNINREDPIHSYNATAIPESAAVPAKQIN